MGLPYPATEAFWLIHYRYILSKEVRLIRKSGNAKLRRDGLYRVIFDSSVASFMLKSWGVLPPEPPGLSMYDYLYLETKDKNAFQ